jgi:4-hydroxy-2-oxovalerate aldolase
LPIGHPELVEVTLRDGSYVIDFQFTGDDTATVGSALQSVGVRWIEVGHGLGLNAAASGHGAAAASDEEYLESASRTLTKARWGMFFIPGIGREEDLRIAAKYKMSFIRIGTNVTEPLRAQRFVEVAKELGFIVSWNAMKSYAVSPAEFGRKVKLVHSWGADVAYLVDSAGGMYPDDITAYLKAARDECGIALGFHGHDNLSMAMANTLRALETGALLVDSSLQGMGRSGGNAITEVLVAIMKKRGCWQEIDLNGLMDIGQGLIRPLMHVTGVEPMAITAGYARFHSSYAEKVEGFARRYKVDVRDVVARLCIEDQVSAPDEVLERLSQEVAGQQLRRVTSIPAFGFDRPRPVSSRATLKAMLKQLRSLASKHGKPSVINIAIADAPLEVVNVSGNIQVTFCHVVLPVNVSNPDQLCEVLEEVDGMVDIVFLDSDQKRFGPTDAAASVRKCLARSLLLTYSDGMVRVAAIEDQVVRFLGEVVQDVSVVVAGNHPLGVRVGCGLSARGCKVSVVSGGDEAPGVDRAGNGLVLGGASGSSRVVFVAGDQDEVAKVFGAARVVIAWPQGDPWFDERCGRHLANGAWLIDAGVGAILPDGVAEARRRGAIPVRMNMWPMLAGALASAHESARIYREAFGWGRIADIEVVAGGALGEAGTIVVDDIRHPKRVLGVADGQGRLRFDYSVEEAEHARRVAEEINRRMFMQCEE